MSQAPAIENISNDKVLSYYTSAASIANKALETAIALSIDGATIVSICQAADALIVKETAALFKKGTKIPNGVGFPTSIGVNNVVGNFSPLPEIKIALKEGDVVKIDLAAQVGGYVAAVAHTIVIGDAEITGTTADVIIGTHTALELASRMITTENNNEFVSSSISKIAADFGVAAVAGVLSHNVEKNTLDGKLIIPNRDDADNRVTKFTFEKLQVFALDVLFSTGDGKPSVSNTERITVYKRDITNTTQMKINSARTILNQIDKNAYGYPFSLRSLDPKCAKLGIVECTQKGVVTGYPTTEEKKGAVVAQFKYTVAILPNGETKVLTGLPLTGNIKSDKKVSDETFVKLLASPITRL